MKIPYGKCDFMSVRERGQFYADKAASIVCVGLQKCVVELVRVVEA